MTEYQIAPINPDVVKQLLIADDGGSPPRCCLTFAEPSERIALVAYEPLRRWAAATGADPGPYLERGPVFVHADGFRGSGGVPYARSRRRVFRFYDSNGSILAGRLVEAGEDQAAVLAESFADERVALVHVRAVEFGCFSTRRGATTRLYLRKHARIAAVARSPSGVCNDMGGMSPK